mgnify:CR=1 FL=1
MSGRKSPPSRPREVEVPRWVFLTTIFISWLSGGAILVFELLGQARLATLLLAAWLITLPIAGTNVLDPLIGALRDTLFGGRR